MTFLASSTPDERRRRDLLYRLLLAGCFVCALAFRSNVLSHESLWYDEYYSATWANFPSIGEAYRTIVEVELHPPLYYLQLWVWARLGEGETWLLLNSVLLGLIAVGGCVFAGTKLHDRNAGRAAGLLCAVATQAVHQSTELRMYAAQMAVVPFAAYFVVRQAEDGALGLKWALGAVAGAGLIGYCHGAGFLWIGTASFIQGVVLVARRAPVKKWLACFGTQALSVLLLLPWMMRAVHFDPQHVRGTSLADAASIGAEVLSLQTPSVFLTVALAIIWTGIAGAAGRANRVGLALALSGPLTLLGALGISQFRPVLHLRAFLYLVPHGCLGLGMCVSELMNCPRRRERWLGFSGFTVLFVTSIATSAPSAFGAPEKSNTNQAIDVLRKWKAAERTVVAFRPGDAFALCWELAGPGAARSRKVRVQCETPAGLRVVRSFRFVRARAREKVFELTLAETAKKPSGYSLRKRKRVGWYAVHKFKRTSPRSALSRFAR